MRLNRSLGVASNPEPARAHRARAGVVRTLSVAALAAAACALSALPALAASAAPAQAGTIATTTTITSPANDVPVPADAGVSVPLTASVVSNTGDTVPTGTVEFIPQNVTPYAAIECSVTLNASGVGTCDVTPPTGTWGFILYEATYTPTAGSDWLTSTSTGEHKVITWDITTTHLTFAPSPATEGNPVTLTATVVDEPLDNLSGAGGGADLVTFTTGDTTICANVPVTDPSDGPDNVATCTYTPTATGSVSITAAYLGDEYALPSSDTETLTVNSPAHPSKTTVSVSPTTAYTRQAVKLSATVTSSGTIPTGTVTFWVSTRELCKGTLSNGKFSCEAGFPNPGPKTIVARYSGSPTVEASSGTAPLTIKKR
jgi:hypothetical protein